MRWSERLATGFVPLMARLLLCAALLPLGWHKVFTTRAYSVRDSARLGAIGVSPDGIDFARMKATGPAWAGGEASPAATPGGEASPAATPAGEATMTARSLYAVALDCEAAGVPWPSMVAWAVALTELAGPALLLAGFFARVAAFAVAAVMAGALWTTGIPALRASGWWSLPMDDYLRLWAQCGLFALALTVLLAGPGWLTVERMMTPRTKAAGDGAKE